MSRGILRTTADALRIFQRAELDVAVLEVGLGGRLDAVNLIDADSALVTGIGIDHVEWLGPDRESIGREKIGIVVSIVGAGVDGARVPGNQLLDLEIIKRRKFRDSGLLRKCGQGECPEQGNHYSNVHNFLPWLQRL